MNTQDRTNVILATVPGAVQDETAIILDSMKAAEVTKVHKVVIKTGDVPSGFYDVPVDVSNLTLAPRHKVELILKSVGEVRQAYDENKEWREYLFEDVRLNEVAISVYRRGGDVLDLSIDAEGVKHARIAAGDKTRMVAGKTYKVEYWEIVAGENYITDRDGNDIEPTVTCNRYIDHKTGGSTRFEIERDLYIAAFEASIELELT